jgi:hypothetical protein
MPAAAPPIAMRALSISDCARSRPREAPNAMRELRAAGRATHDRATSEPQSLITNPESLIIDRILESSTIDSRP